VFFENLPKGFEFEENLTKITGNLHGEAWGCGVVIEALRY
jgi:hypothetical protein